MAEIKTLKTKIALLYKTYEEWNAIKDTYKPLKGEVCFCDVPASTGAVSSEPAILFKVGKDGETSFAQLPWASALAADIYSWAKKENLEFADLSDDFRDTLEEFIEQHSSQVDTKYQIVAAGKDQWKLQKSLDGVSWEDATGLIDISSKVDRLIESETGKAMIFNEADGGGSKFEGANGVDAYIGTHTNIGGEIGVQAYVDKADGSGSTIIDITQNGAYYTKGAVVPGAQRDVEANELATKGDIAAIEIPEYSLVKDTESGDYAAVYHLTKDDESIGDPINIPKDQLLKSVEVKTCTVKDEPISGLEIGDKYLDFTFIVEKGVESHTYIAIKDMAKPYTAGPGIIINPDNSITYDEEVVASVEFVDASISDTMAYVIQEDEEETAARIAGDNLLANDIAKKVDKEVEGGNGTAYVFNESDGGGAKFVHNDGSEAYVGVNDGGEDGLMVQIYADIKKNDKWSGSRINVYNDGIYYTNQEAVDSGISHNDPDYEIAVKKDVENAIDGLANIAHTGNVNDLIQDDGDILILNCNI